MTEKTPILSVEGFIKLANFLWNDKLRTAFLATILGIGCFVYFQSQKIDIKLDMLHYITRPSVDVEKQRTDHIQLTDAALQPMFERTLVKVDSDRVVAYMFSNNHQGVGGDSWAYISARYVAVNEGIQYDITKAQNLPFSTWNEVVEKVTPATGGTYCAWFETNEIKSSWLRSWGRALGTTTSMACGIRGSSGNQKGFVVAGWVRRIPALERSLIEKEMRALAEEVAVRTEPDHP